MTTLSRPRVGDEGVGPVVQAGALGEAIVAAIRERHPEARVVDRGAYLRVLVPGRCVLDADRVAARTGRPFRLPADLELAMTSFKGRLAIDDDAAVWEAR